ncbi:MAG TPA: hypothetical protein VIW24_11160 [Aldersonia sp.]
MADHDEPTKKFDKKVPNPAEAPEDAPADDTPADDAETPAEEPAYDAGDDEPLERKRSPWLVATSIVAIALLVLLFVAVPLTLLYQRYADKRDVLDAQNAARTEMCRYAAVLVDYDYTDLDTFFGKVLDGATGDWHTEFEANSAALRDPLVAGQVHSQGNDFQCGIISGDENHAVVVVTITQTITSLGTQNQPQKGQIAVVATMENVDGRWLVSKMDAPVLSP